MNNKCINEVLSSNICSIFFKSILSMLLLHTMVNGRHWVRYE